MLTPQCNSDFECVAHVTQNANSQGLKGAGVGKVKVTNGTPQVVERMGDNGFWWDSTTNPRYGDSVAYSDTKSDYIYAIGGAPTSITDPTGSLYQYMVRVQKSSAFDLSSYEYWHGRQQGWSSSPLSTFSSETAVLWGTGQGQIVWNEHYNCYIYVHMSKLARSEIYLDYSLTTCSDRR